MMNNWHMEAPFGVVTAVTYKCNLKCKHCFAGSPELDNEATVADMTTEQWKDLIHQLADMSVHEIYFGGGEPFIRRDMMEIITEARRTGLGTTLTTNGTVIKEESIKQLADLGVECVEVSIDGTQEIHDFLRGVPGAYQKSLQTIEWLDKYNIYVIASVTFSKENIPVSGQIIREVTDAGVKEILFMRFVPCGIGRKYKERLYITEQEYRDAVVELLKKYEPEMKPEEMNKLNESNHFFKKSQAAYDGYFYPHAGCIAGRTYCFIRPNGDITPCNPLSFPEHIAGNVTRQQFADIWNNSPVLQKIRAIEHKDLPDCYTCSKAEMCAGGCRIMCHTYSGYCTNDCDNCSRTESCNEASGLCGKKYMYYMRVNNA